MASKEHAIKNNLNDRARKVGQFDELTTQDIDALIAFYDYSCLQCGEKPASSVDHVKPLSKGGTNTRDNLQLLCTNHNKAKGDEEIDYRNGKVCPADFTAPTAQEKPQNKRGNKVDWNAVRLQYVTGNMSIRELAEMEGIPFDTLAHHAYRIEDWNQQRAEHHIKVTELSQQAIAEKEVKARSLTFDLGVEIVQDWRRNIKRNTTAAEVTGILKVLLAMQGQAGERVEHVEANVSDAELYNRIVGAFDPGEEEGNITSGPDQGEETGAGWTD
jgi:hypothetical protein